MKLRVTTEQKDIIIVFLTIYLSFSWVPDAASMPIKLLFFLLLILIILYFKYKELRKNFSGIGLLFLFIFVILYISFIHQRISDISWIIKILLAYVVFISVSFHSFLKSSVSISNIIFWPTIIGFAFGVLGVTFRIPDFMLAVDKVYYLTPLLTAQRHALESRAFSIFWEPGVFCFFSIFIICLKLFYFKLRFKSIHKEIIYVLISQSVGGFFSLSILLFFYFFEKRKIFVSFVSLFGVLSYIFFVIYNSLVFELLANIINIFTIPLFQRDMTLDPSFAARGIDFFLPFTLSYESGFFGFKTISEFEYYATIIRGFSAKIITNSWGSLAYFYGLPFMMFYVILSYKFISRISYDNRYPLLYWWLIALSASPVYTTIFITFMLISSNETKPRKK